MSDFLDRLAQLAWTQTWQIAAVVLAVTLVTRLGPVRRRPHLAYALWLLVLAKCLTPPLWASPASPFSWALASTVTPVVETPSAPIPDFDPPQDATMPESDLPPPRLLPQPAQPLVDNGNHWIEADAIPAAPAAELPLPASPESAGPVMTPRAWLVLAWIVGGTFYFMLSLGRYLSTRRRLIRSGNADTGRLDEIIGDLSRSLRLRRSPRAILTSQQFGPAVLGTFRPVLIVPESTAAALSSEQLRLVLAHELVHLRRGDHWMGLLQFLVQSLWWFNPLVWWANREIDRVREQCCDEEVVSRLSCEPGGYAQTLLDIVRLGARPRSLVLTAGVSAMHITGQRLQHIMSDASRFHRTTPRTYWLTAAVVAMLLLPGAGLALVRDDEQSTTAPSTEKAVSHQASEKAQPAAEKNTNDKSQDKFYDLPITVTGRAYDQSGKPLQGATIYLVSTGVSKDKLLGLTTSAQDGYYEFRDHKLPIWVAADKDWFEQGAFQVFGQAPGRAFAWEGMKSLLVDKRAHANSTSFLPGQQIELDLVFSPPKAVTGRFIDEEGKGIAGVKVRLASCDYLDHAGRESHVNNREFWAIKQAADMMPDKLLAVSDEDGNFSFSAVPPDVVCWLVIEHPNYADVTLYTSTSADAPAELEDGHPISKLPLELTLRKVRTISVQVVSAANGQPVAGVSVSGSQKRATGPSDASDSDKNGKLTLKLPPGEYKLVGDPPRYGTDFVRTYQDLIVMETPAEQAATLRINDGCVLVLKAIDADTGKPIAGVPFWYEMDDPKGTRTSVQSNTTHVDHPKTNEKGELRAVVYPGKRRYGVGFRPLPEGYRITTSDMRGKELELVAGKTVVAEFTLRKQGADRTSDDKKQPQGNVGKARGRARALNETEKAAQVTIEAQVTDSSGKPVSGQRMLLDGRSQGEDYQSFADSDGDGTIRMDVPRGIQHLSLWLLNADSETIARFGPSDRAHLRLNGRLEVFDLFEDWKAIKITRFRCPTLLVKAVDATGKTIEGFKTELTYITTPANAVGAIRGQRGDVYFARQPDGRWRSQQLIPDKEFTLAATAPGYQAAFEKLSLREAEVKELTVTLSPGERDGQPEGAKDDAETGRPAATLVNSTGIKFALIPAGQFTMGSPEDEEGHPPMIGSVKNVEEMQHTVRITRPFYMSLYEVTQEQYEAVMGSNPSQYGPQGTHKDRVKNRDTKRFPVENVRWFEANEFCKRISARDGKTYRLPTEAEWEYACRAGTTTVFSFGDTFDGTQANFDGAYPRGTERKGNRLWGPTTVGSYKPNAFGLYDMHGNVWEWCSDLSANGYYAFSQRDDPPGPPITAFNPHFVKEETYNRAARGGAFYLDPHYCRSASRAGWEPDFPRNHINRSFGIRLVCEVPREKNS